MNDEFRNGEIRVHPNEIIELFFRIPAETRFYGHRDRKRFREHRFEKLPELVRMPEEAASLSLPGYRAHRAAEVEVHLAVTEFGKALRSPEEAVCVFSHQLRDDIHPAVRFRGQLPHLTFRKLGLHGRGDKRGVVPVDAAEKFMMPPPENNSGEAFHGSQSEKHGSIQINEIEVAWERAQSPFPAGRTS